MFLSCFWKKKFVSHHVIFDENVFPFSSQDAQVPRSSTNSIREPITLQLPMFHSQPTPHASSETDVITSL